MITKKTVRELDEDFVYLDDIVIGKGALTDTVYAGVLGEDRNYFLDKKDVTGYFAQAMVDMYAGHVSTFTLLDSSGKKRKYKIELTEVKGDE